MLVIHVYQTVYCGEIRVTDEYEKNFPQTAKALRDRDRIATRMFVKQNEGALTKELVERERYTYEER